MPLSKEAQSKGGKTGKRGPGTDTVALRKRVELLLDENFDQVQRDLAELSPRDRIDSYIRLLDFALPRLQRITSSVYESKTPPPILSTNGLIDNNEE
jgi:hypothetical protein